MKDYTKRHAAVHLWNEEITELSALARAVPNGGTIVEIGLGLGESASIFTRAAHKRKVSVFSVDVHPDAKVQGTLKSLGVHIIAKSSTVTSRDWRKKKKPIDLLFIDGGHSFHDIFGDYNAWVGNLCPGALVAFHDYDTPERSGFVHLGVEVFARGIIHAGLLSAPRRVGRLLIGAIQDPFRARLTLESCRRGIADLQEKVRRALRRVPATSPLETLRFLQSRGVFSSATKDAISLTSLEACLIFESLPEQVGVRYAEKSPFPKEFVRLFETLTMFRAACGPSFLLNNKQRATNLSRKLSEEHVRLHIIALILQPLLPWTL